MKDYIESTNEGIICGSDTWNNVVTMNITPDTTITANVPYPISHPINPYPVSWSYPYGGYIGSTVNWTTIRPSEEILSDPLLMEALIDKMLTVQKPGEKLIVCLDSGFTAQQVQEISDILDAHGLDAIVIPGARAGYSYGGKIPVRDDQQRIDILARLGELWERHPEMPLTDLLEWYNGQSMSDEDFIACTEVHFKKKQE
jgi:hypothetical protein